MNKTTEQRDDRNVVRVQSAEVVENKDQFLDEVIAVEQSAWPVELQAARAKMEARLEIFPEGFFVARVNDQAKGISTSQVTEYPSSAKTWDEITDNGFIRKTHTLNGNALYVVSIGVASDAQGMGLGSKLLEAQKELARRKNLKYLFLGARIPGYAAYCEKNGKISMEEYLNLKTEKGERLDPEIRFYERKGLQMGPLKPNFEPDDQSKNYGILMVWENK